MSVLIDVTNQVDFDGRVSVEEKSEVVIDEKSSLRSFGVRADSVNEDDSSTTDDGSLGFCNGFSDKILEGCDMEDSLLIDEAEFFFCNLFETENEKVCDKCVEIRKTGPNGSSAAIDRLREIVAAARDCVTCRKISKYGGALTRFKKPIKGKYGRCLVRLLKPNSSKRVGFSNDFGFTESKRKIFVNQVLTGEKEELLIKTFPELEITFTRKVYAPHAYAAASRLAETELLAIRIGNANFIDAGGNYAHHLVFNRTNVHCCCPSLDARDSARETERKLRIQAFAQKKHAVVHKALQRYRDNVDAVYCRNKVHKCNVEADYITSVQVYDIPFEQLGTAMDAHGAKVWYGTFIYSSNVLLNNDKKGFISGVEAHYEIDERKDEIKFTFRNDSSNGYIHSYSNYLKYVTNISITTDKNVYFYELQENRAGVQFFKVTLCDTKGTKTGRFFKNLWPENEEHVIVRTYDYGADYKRRIGLLGGKFDFREFSRKDVAIPKKLLQNGMGYALQLTKEIEKLTVNSVFDCMRSFNARLVVNATNIGGSDSVSSEDLFRVCTTILVAAVGIKIRQIIVEKKMKDISKKRMDVLRKWTSSLGMMAAWNVIKEGVNAGGGTTESSLRTWYREHCGVDFDENITPSQLCYTYEQKSYETKTERIKNGYLTRLLTSAEINRMLDDEGNFVPDIQLTGMRINREQENGRFESIPEEVKLFAMAKATEGKFVSADSANGDCAVSAICNAVEEIDLDSCKKKFLEICDTYGRKHTTGFDASTFIAVAAELIGPFVLTVMNGCRSGIYMNVAGINEEGVDDVGKFKFFLLRDGHFHHRSDTGTVEIKIDSVDEIKVFNDDYTPEMEFTQNLLSTVGRGEVRFSTSYSAEIARNFKKKMYGPAPVRNFGIQKACYYKMMQIDDSSAVYRKNKRVLVVGPGQLGSVQYHLENNKEVHTVGPIESDNAETISGIRSKIDANFEEKHFKEIKRLFVDNKFTYENDAMIGYNKCPTKEHLKILKTSFLFLKAVKPNKVIQKIFLSDVNIEYTKLIFEMIRVYRSYKFVRPEAGSLGTTEMYLVLSAEFDYDNSEDLTEEALCQRISEWLSVVLKELDSRKGLRKPNQPRTNCNTVRREFLGDDERQLARVSDVKRYWTSEVEQLTAYSKKMWDDLQISKGEGNFNRSSAKAYKASDEFAILKRNSDGFYYPFVPNGAVDLFNQACGEYDVAFAAAEFVALHKTIVVENGVFVDKYKADCNLPFILVYDALRLFQASRKLEKVDFGKFSPYRSNITLIEGVPGSGKTYELTHKAKSGELVLTVAKKTKEETSERIKELKKEVLTLTVDSYFINYQSKHENVYIDEGLMLQPGEIDLIASISKAKIITIFGDRKQLKFIPRVAGFDSVFPEFTDFTTYEFRNMSRRCPADVSQLFFNDYKAGFFTKNRIRRSMFSYVINGKHVVKKDDKYKVLVFTQNEKKELIDSGHSNTNTIHEVQGMTFSHVRIVRLYPQQMTIYESEPHILVALTRHTERLEYLTVRAADVICKKLSKKSETNVYDVDVAMEKSRNCLIRTTEIIHDVGIVKKPTQPEVVITYQQVEQRSHCNSKEAEKLTDQLKNDLFLSGGSYSICETYRKEILSDITPLVTMGGYVGLAMPEYALQNYYDSIVTYNNFELKDFDEYQVELNDLTVYASGIRIDTSKLGTDTSKLLPLYTVKSKLRTNQPNTREPTARQTLIALAKRNCDAPKNALPLNVAQTLNKTMDRFFNAFCHQDARNLMKSYREEPVELNEVTLRDWICGQEPGKIKRFDLRELEVDLNAVVRYQMMIKKEPKNKLEAVASEEYAGVQNIIHHPHRLNAVFGAIFKKMYDRLESLLAPNILLLIRKSTEQMNLHMNRTLTTDKQWEKHLLEIDFSKFDKCQLQTCFEIEMKFWEDLGFEKHLHELWKLGHFDCNAIDFKNGIKAWLMYQRKSGDSATCLGNSLIAMLSIAFATNLKNTEIKSGCFMGDDSLLYTLVKIDGNDVVKKLMEVFNLSAKVITKKYGYMCSMFVIPVVDSYVVVPDPLKRIERLGKNLKLKENETLYERYVSFRELLLPLFTVGIDLPLTEALEERYGPSDFDFLALDGLRTIAADFAAFSRLFERAPVDVFKFFKINSIIKH